MGLRHMLGVTEWVSVARARQQLAAGALLLDVSRNGDWTAGHPVGAIHIPLDELQDRLASLPVGVPIVTICRSGSGTAAAAGAQLLTGAGHRASAVRGGLPAWAAAGGPLTYRVPSGSANRV